MRAGGGLGRQWPDISFGAALLLATVGSSAALRGGMTVAALPAAAVMAWQAGRWMSRLAAAVLTIAAGSVVSVLYHALVVAWGSWSSAVSVLFLVLLFVVLPWWLGRGRRLRIEQSWRERSLLERQARSGERHRIARGVHDSIGHDLALIALQAGAWELSAGSTAEQQTAAAVRERATAATDRLQTLVWLLEDQPTTGPLPSPEDSVVPAADLQGVVDQARGSGLAVTLRRLGDADGLPAWSTDVRQALVRLVQEALTNVSKHAAGSVAQVILRDADPVQLEVVNPLPHVTSAAPRMGGGTGLAGLAEHVRLLGGTLQADSVGGTFRLHVSLPRTAVPGPRPGGRLRASPVLRAARRDARRRRLVTAALPVVLVLVLVLVVVGGQVVTVRQTALSPQRFAVLELGQSRSEIADLLPPRRQESAPPVVSVPPVPEGSRCELYQARASVLDLNQSMYRLCFDVTADAKLIAKDHLLAGG